MRALHSKIPKPQVQPISKAQLRQSPISNPQVECEVQLNLGSWISKCGPYIQKSQNPKSNQPPIVFKVVAVTTTNLSRW
jgi:hypothetical protein